jgi:hypothetical protein
MIGMGVWAGTEAKMARARELTDDLISACDVWGSAHEPAMEETTEDGWLYWWVLPPAEEPPAALGIRVGEIAYNLRSALDHVAWALVEANGKRPGKHTHFPCTLSEQAWNTARGSQIRGIAVAAVGAIRRWQPFVRNPGVPRADLFAGINEIGLVDKHRTLLVTAAALRLANVRGTLPGKMHYQADHRDLGNGLTLQQREWIARFKWTPAHPSAEGKRPQLGESTLHAGVKFATFDPFRVEFPPAVMWQFIDHVQAIVDDVQQHL